MGEAPEAKLEFVQFKLRPPPEYATAWELAFELINTGNAKAVLSTIRLIVDEAHPSETLRLVNTGAPIVLHRLHVRLTPETREVDIRGRVFGASVEPRSFPPEEVESFLVDISSSKGYIYRCHLIADWYEVRRPGIERQTESPSFTLDFAPEPEELLLRNPNEPFEKPPEHPSPAYPPPLPTETNTRPAFAQHLSSKEIDELYKAIVETGLDKERDTLLSGIDPSFVASLPNARSNSSQLLSDLNSLNRVELLGDGSVPIYQWLSNAIRMRSSQPEAELFREARNKISSATAGQRNGNGNPP